MKLSKRAIVIVIGLATIALVGLSILQIQNLRSSIIINRKTFLHKVDLASNKVSSFFISNPEYGQLLHQAVDRIKLSKELNDPDMDVRMKHVINPVLEEFGLDIPYEYAIYIHKESQDGYKFVMGDDGATLEFELVDCSNPQERGHGWANLTCSRGFGDDNNFHLALFFPSQDAYVFAQSSGALILSIVFIVLLIGCFSYALIVIQKQKKLSAIKNDFINNLTHEFKTPIASIALATSMLKSNNVEVDEHRRANYLDLIDLESKRLEGQVDKVLQIAMIGSGNFSLEKKKLDVHEAINQVVKSMVLIASKRQGNIELSLDAKHSEVVADRTHLVNIIYNLVDNALKYTVGVPKILIATSDVDEGIRISIRDNGIGIGQEIQKYIFDKFYRAETGDVRNAKGFGLGLSYVKKIIEAHKGSIDLSSRLNHGSEFHLFFPLS